MRCWIISLLIFITISCQDKIQENRRPVSTVSDISIWPTKEWKYKNYTEANINGQLLRNIRDSVVEKHSLLVVKDGYIVHESYQAPYEKDSLIHVNSCTKSVISILFGMVFRNQLEVHENQPAISYFPEYQTNDTSLNNIKVKHFLSMSSGLKWRGGIDATDVLAMSETNDWAKYVFQRKPECDPGEVYHYNSGGTQVVSSILHRTLETGLADYARDSLFRTLGIIDFKWEQTAKEILKAGWGLHLKMHDMAKLGYLLLNKGKWEEQQLVPEKWIDVATKTQINVNDQYDYGYQFWISRNIGVDNYFFRGSYPPSKKIITIIPELNTVVVYVGEYGKTDMLLKDFIIPALKIQDIE